MKICGETVQFFFQRGWRDEGGDGGLEPRGKPRHRPPLLHLPTADTQPTHLPLCRVLCQVDKRMQTAVCGVKGVCGDNLPALHMDS